MQVVAGLVSSKDLIAEALKTEKIRLLTQLSGAIEKPVTPRVTDRGECQDIVEKDVDLTKLPIMRYTAKDGGKYIASAVAIIRDPETTKHLRLMLLDRNTL
jgi:2,5-furandicarboxylate decarboxylase 1